MCSSPKIPAPPPPPQEAKAPDSMSERRQARGGAMNPTLLTGSTGVARGSLNTGGSTLLGG